MVFIGDDCGVQRMVYMVVVMVRNVECLVEVREVEVER